MRHKPSQDVFEGNFPGSEYTDEEVEFFKAMELFKKVCHRRFPTWRDVLHVIKALGYRKLPQPDDKQSNNEEIRHSE